MTGVQALKQERENEPFTVKNVSGFFIPA